MKAATKTATPAKPAWPLDIYNVFKKVGIRQIAYVPDAGHTQLIKSCHADKSMKAISLTTEEEGVAMLAGTWMGGARGVSEAPYGGTFTLECGLNPMEPSSMVLANTAWSVVRLFP